MSFSSPLFVFLFLPVVVAGHALLPARFQNLFLLLSSFLYFIATDVQHLLIVVCLISVNHVFALLLASHATPAGRRNYLGLTVITNLLVLMYFKYSAFLIQNLNIVAKPLGITPAVLNDISAPLGLSFLIFQIIAYQVDCYTNITAPQKSIARFSLFILLFPKITAGPIIRHNDVSASLAARSMTMDDLEYGLKRFIVGLSKKVLVADVLAKGVNPAFSLQQHELGPAATWLVVLCYSLQIYYDFSGYSDMAIGIGRMLGFSLPENFDNPYCSRSLTEFWRRWHISLSAWLKDYLFIPLSYHLTTERIREKIASGSFKPKYITAFSAIIVFTCCGLWHGAAWTFVAWGIAHGVVLALESLGLSKRMKSWWRPLQHGYTLLFLMITWALFRSPSLDYARGCLRSMAFLSGGSAPFDVELAFIMTREIAVTLVIALILVVPFRDIITRSGDANGICRRFARMSVSGGLISALYLVLLVLSLASLSSATYNPFLYGRF